jgi:PilZ domain
MERFVEKFEPDRRLSLRHDFRTGLRLRLRNSNVGELRVVSRNLSQRGVFFATELELTKGAALDLLVEMPEQITGVPTAQWLCTGHVVRVVPVNSPQGDRGVGVQFDFYEVSRPERPQWAVGVGMRALRLPLASASTD